MFRETKGRLQIKYRDSTAMHRCEAVQVVVDFMGFLFLQGNSNGSNHHHLHKMVLRMGQIFISMIRHILHKMKNVALDDLSKRVS